MRLVFIALSGIFFHLQSSALHAGVMGDRVFEDLNANGVHEPGEPGLGGVTVYIENCSGSVLSSVVSASDGSYAFEDLSAGRYQLRVAAPLGYTISPLNQQGDWAVDSDFDPVTGYASCLPLNENQTRRAIDAGLYASGPQGSAVIGDRIWSDLNGDGLMEAGEPGLAGIEMTLMLCDGTFVASTLSSTDGAYLFDNLPANTYQVGMRVPPGYQVSPLTVGDWSMNNDFLANGTTECRTLADGQTRRGVDGGLVPGSIGSGTVGNFVWNDLNGNGLQDGGEPGLAGVGLELQFCDGTVVATTVSTGSGSYLFENLPVNDYQVRMTAPTGFEITAQGTGADYIIDNDFDPATGLTTCRSLVSGQSRLGIDGGLITSSGGNTGEVVCPGGGTAYLGDWVWEDTNGDGIQQRAVEPGIGGIEVKIYECSGRPENGCQCETTPFCRTTTTASGGWGFSGLAPGAYQLRITVAGSPYRDGPTHVVSHDIDNDFGNHFNDGDVVGYCKVMAAGQRRPGADAGLVPR